MWWWLACALCGLCAWGWHVLQRERWRRPVVFYLAGRPGEPGFEAAASALNAARLPWRSSGLSLERLLRAWRAPDSPTLLCSDGFSLSGAHAIAAWVCGRDFPLSPSEGKVGDACRALCSLEPRDWGALGRLLDDQEFVLGEHYTAADTMLVFHLLRRSRGPRVAAAEEEEEEEAALRRYLERCRAGPFVAAAALAEGRKPRLWVPPPQYGVLP